MMRSHLNGWMSEDIMRIAVPLNEKYTSDNYIIHHYSGMDISIAITICEEMLSSLNISEAVNIYLYIVDYPHEHTRLDRIGSNNGYTQLVGDCFSVVIFRKRFWPKVLIHELLHVVWLSNNIRSSNIYPRWDEAIIEANAVKIAISKGYINGAEYDYYIKMSKREIENSLQIMGGNVMDVLKRKQKTHLYEYLYLSEEIRLLLNAL